MEKKWEDTPSATLKFLRKKRDDLINEIIKCLNFDLMLDLNQSADL